MDKRSFGLPLYLILAVNVLAFVVPYMNGTLDEVQFLYGILAPAVSSGEYHRLITSAFIHFGTMHLLMNMGALFAYGSSIVETFGSLRFLFIYTITAIGSSVGVWFLSSQNTLTAGASGALYGLAGYIIAYLFISKNYRIGNIPREGIGGLFLWLVLWNLIPGVSVAGHLSGMFAGLVLGFVYAKLDKYKLWRRQQVWREKGVVAIKKRNSAKARGSFIPYMRVGLGGCSFMVLCACIYYGTIKGLLWTVLITVLGFGYIYLLELINEDMGIFQGVCVSIVTVVVVSFGFVYMRGDFNLVNSSETIKVADEGYVAQSNRTGSNEEFKQVKKTDEKPKDISKQDKTIKSKSNVTSKQDWAGYFAKMPFTVEAEYLVEKPYVSYKHTYSFKIDNQSSSDILNLSYLVLEWDSKGMPVTPAVGLGTAYGGLDYMVAGTSLRQVNIPAGDSYVYVQEFYPTDIDYYSSEKDGHTRVFIPYSYDTYDHTWTNPRIDEYLEQYAGKKYEN